MAMRGREDAIGALGSRILLPSAQSPTTFATVHMAHHSKTEKKKHIPLFHSHSLLSIGNGNSFSLIILNYKQVNLTIF